MPVPYSAQALLCVRTCQDVRMMNMDINIFCIGFDPCDVLGNEWLGLMVSQMFDELSGKNLRCKMEFLASVPTMTLGKSGVKRKKLRGLTMVTLYLDVSRF